MRRWILAGAALLALVPSLGCDGDSLFTDLVSLNGPAVDVASIEVDPFQGSIQVGGSIQLSAILRNELGEEVTGPPVVWSSSQPFTAAVGSSGLVTGVGVGLANITASAGGQSATATITVTNN